MQIRNKPLTTTSANISGQAPETNGRDLEFEEVDGIYCVDSEESLSGAASTVVKWDGSELTLLREGQVPFEGLAESVRN